MAVTVAITLIVQTVIKAPIKRPDPIHFPPLLTNISDEGGTAKDLLLDNSDKATLESPVLGIALNLHHISHLDWYLEGIDAIASLGADSLIILTPMWMENAESTEIRYLKDRCPTEEQILKILSRAQQHELRTFLLPIVLLEDADENDWRGVIRPRDWDAWWTSYEAFLDYYIQIANKGSIDVLSVGSELNSTEAQVTEWERVIANVREKYNGHLMYSANWDRYHRVMFWDDLDMMAVSSYFELVSDTTVPSLKGLEAAWNVQRDAMLKTADRYGKPLVLTEVGYPSLPTAAAHPWDYVNRDGLDADHNTQALCWRAFFQSWSRIISRTDNNAIGFFAYHWDPYNHGGNDDTGYGMNGKPSMEVIRRGFAKIRRRVQ